MKSYFALLALLTIILLSFSALAGAPFTCEMLTGMKPDVQKLLKRMSTCNYLAGEHTGGSSKERDAQINKAVEENRCSAVDSDRLELLKKHWGDPQLATHLLYADENDGLPILIECK